MYASVRHAAGKPGSRDEVKRIIEDGYTDRLAEISGFQGYYVVETGADHLITISLFDDQTGAEESARIAQELVSSRLAPHMSSELKVHNGEVVVHKKP